MHPVVALLILSVYSYVAVHWLPFILALIGAFVVGYAALESVFTKGAPHMSTRRKLMMASWGSPSEAQVFGTITVNAEKLLAYLEKQAAAGVKTSVTTCAVKACALAVKEAPGFNTHIAFGKFVPRTSVDISCLVSLDEGSDLAVAKVSHVDQKTLKDVTEELKNKAEKLRKHKDKDFESSKPLMAMLPVYILEPVVAAVGYLAGALGMNIPALGVRPFPFGSVMVTSVGMLGVEMAFVPFTPFARVPFLLMVGECALKAVVAPDGKTIVAQQTLVLTGTLDHRFADGTEAGRMAKKIKWALENPEESMDDTTPMRSPDQIAKDKAEARAAKIAAKGKAQ